MSNNSAVIKFTLSEKNKEKLFDLLDNDSRKVEKVLREMVRSYIED